MCKLELIMKKSPKTLKNRFELYVLYYCHTISSCQVAEQENGYPKFSPIIKSEFLQLLSIFCFFSKFLPEKLIFSLVLNVP